MCRVLDPEMSRVTARQERPMDTMKTTGRAESDAYAVGKARVVAASPRDDILLGSSAVVLVRASDCNTQNATLAKKQNKTKGMCRKNLSNAESLCSRAWSGWLGLGATLGKKGHLTLFECHSSGT